MIYRKQPAQAPTLLLRIVSTAGAGALLGAAACSSDGTSPCGGHYCGVGTMPQDAQAEVQTVGGGITGIVISPDSGSPPEGQDAAAGQSGDDASTAPCHPCGTVAMPEDAGSETSLVGVIVTGVLPFPDDGGVHGVVVNPNADL